MRITAKYLSLLVSALIAAFMSVACSGLFGTDSSDNQKEEAKRLPSNVSFIWGDENDYFGFEYDSSGNLIQLNLYDDDSNLEGATFNYSDSRIECIASDGSGNSDGSARVTMKLTAGKVTGYTVYESYGNGKWKEDRVGVISYNDDGKPSGIMVIDEYGVISTSYKWVNGNLTEVTNKYSGTNLSREETQYLKYGNEENKVGTVKFR